MSVSNEIAVRRDQITKVREEAALFNRRVATRGFSYTLAAQFLYDRLLENNAWVTMEEMTAVAGRERATKAAVRATRGRMAALRREALKNRIFIIKECAAHGGNEHGKIQATRIYEIDTATPHDIDLANQELAEKIRRREISNQDAQAISDALSKRRTEMLLEDEE